MASVTDKPQPSPAPQPAQRAEEQLVDQQISRTRRALKMVDLAAGVITLSIGVLAFLLTMALLEHWVIPGGWGETTRFGLFGVLIFGVAIYCWRTFWPILRQPINPVFAALAIEQSSPSLKNSLLNLLLLRNRKRKLSRQVLLAIEQQAAQRLSQVPIESVVDRSAILRLGYILLALTAVCAMYRLFSPKDPFSSAGRVLMPWSSIATPSRVQILDVTPGDTKAARGEQLKVSAEVFGLEVDEPVRLMYSTADEQIVRRELTMTASAGGTLYSCQVPGRIGSGSNGNGIQNDFSYWIEAGDARSPHYQVEVFARPTMVVGRLRYDYPAYTGYSSREVEHTGDIRAVEGTKVTLFAQTNKPIETAHVDFEADGRSDLLMKSNDQLATVTFPLALCDDRRTPRYQSYVLRYKTTAGNQNRHPPKYQIDVQPDYSPEIQLLLPAEAVLEVALNQEVNFELEARDPDFALSQVFLVGKLGEEQILQAELLARDHTGKFVGKLRKTPEELGLRVGDVLEYWGAAADNRQPKANIAYSAHRKLRVIGPWQGDPQGEKNQEGEGEQQQGEGSEQQEGEGGQEGQTGAGEQGNSGEGEEGEHGEGTSGQKDNNQKENPEQQTQGESASADGNSQNPDSQNDTGGPTPNEKSPSENSENSDSQNDSKQPSDEGEGEDTGGEQGKVSSGGDDDGSAFERMAEHFKEKEGQEQDAENGGGAAASDGETTDGAQDSNQSPDADQSTDGSGSEENVARESDQSDSKEGAAQDRESAGEGAQGEPAAGKERPEQGEEKQQQQGEQSPDGAMSPEQGEAGAGDSAGDQQGTPNPDGGKKPQDKSGDQADAAEQGESEAASKAGDNAESDSEGGQGGDRSGGGQEGAGQQADADGKGGAGEHQAADDGAGQASETGDGQTGKEAGDQKQAEGKTGESSGDQTGNGTKQSNQKGEQPDTGESASAEGQSGEQNSEQSQQQPNEAQAGDPSGGTGGNPDSPPPAGETQPGDEANLDYARKQTDLILDRLEDQLKKQNVDKSLLEKLGWTKDELRRFVNRWKHLKSQADNKPNSADENQQLNDALRSLGIGRNRRTGYQSKVTKDKLRDLRDAYRGRVPLEYQEQVNRYIKGTATAREE